MAAVVLVEADFAVGTDFAAGLAAAAVVDPLTGPSAFSRLLAAFVLIFFAESVLSPRVLPDDGAMAAAAGDWFFVNDLIGAGSEAMSFSAFDFTEAPAATDFGATVDFGAATGVRATMDFGLVVLVWVVAGGGRVFETAGVLRAALALDGMGERTP